MGVKKGPQHLAFLSWKTSRFHFVMGLYHNRWQKMWKRCNNTSDTLSCASHATLLFLIQFDNLTEQMHSNMESICYNTPSICYLQWGFDREAASSIGERGRKSLKFFFSLIQTSKIKPARSNKIEILERVVKRSNFVCL